MTEAPAGIGPVGNTYDKYGSTNPIERRLMAGFFGALGQQLAGLDPSRILEVGAGEGVVAALARDRFAGVPLFCMDLPDPGAARQWASRELQGLFGDLCRLPIRDGAFDLILGIEVLEHVTDPDAALSELARVATGDVILSVPREPIWRMANMARGKYLGQWGNTPGHCNHWSRRGFVKLVSRHFEVCSVRSPLPWTLVHAHRRR